MKKLIEWLKRPFYQMDNSDKVDWLLILVVLVVTISLVAAAYGLMIM